MTPRQASRVIGCSVGQVRTLVRTGRLPATRCKSVGGGYYYEIDRRHVYKYRDTPQSRGYPRGKPRKENNDG